MSDILILNQCRICLDNDNQSDIFSPCKCRGTSKHVHKKCLYNWIESSQNQSYKNICQECTYEYKKKEVSSIYLNCIKKLLNPFIVSFLLFFMNGLIILITECINNQFLNNIVHKYDKHGVLWYYNSTADMYIILLCYSSIILLGIIFLLMLINYYINRKNNIYIKYHFTWLKLILITGIICSYIFNTIYLFYIWCQWLCHTLFSNLNLLIYSNFLLQKEQILEYISEDNQINITIDNETNSNQTSRTNSTRDSDGFRTIDLNSSDLTGSDLTNNNTNSSRNSSRRNSNDLNIYDRNTHILIRL